jgi:hypothetical protein
LLYTTVLLAGLIELNALTAVSASPHSQSADESSARDEGQPIAALPANRYATSARLHLALGCH